MWTSSGSIVSSILTTPVSAVTQCNDATNGGGGTLRCSVQVTNNFVGLSPGAGTATVNQCVGSGGGITALINKQVPIAASSRARTPARPAGR